MITEGCVLEMFANRLSEVDRDTCLVYDSYSPNNKINASIFFVDKNGAANYIPFRGSLCSKEKGKTKLDSVEYDLRLYLTSVKARQGLLKRTPTKKETSKVLDTLVLRKFTMDKRVSNGKTLFYPMNKIDGFENYFFRNIDSLDYYMASLVKDSVFYLRNVKGQTNEFQDMDVDGLQSFLSSLNSYERELWENDDCNDKKEQVIIWNDSTLNLASFSCASNE